jgi:hypothetical protein
MWKSFLVGLLEEVVKDIVKAELQKHGLSPKEDK